MSSLENLSRKRFFLCTALGIAIVAGIALTQPAVEKKEVLSLPLSTTPLAEALSQVPENIPSRQFNMQQWESSLNVPVYFIHTPELDMLDIVLNINAGSSRDGEQAGLATLTASLLDNGSNKKTADELARSLEQLGSQYYSFADRDRTIVYLRTLADKEHLSPSINLLTEIISQPAFRKDDFDRLKNQQLQTITSLDKDPEYQSWLFLAKSLYLNHPYATPDLGTEQTLTAISEKNVRDFHRTYYVTHNLSIVMTGNITQEQAEQISEQISLSFPVGAPATAMPPPDNRRSTASQHIPLETEQVHISLGFQGINRASPDYPALYIANHIFGGNGLTSILMDQLREQQGLVYGAYSTLTTEYYGGSFIVSTETRVEEAGHTVNEIKRLLNDFVTRGPTEQQLEDAKKMINGSFPLSTASNAALAHQFGEIAFYHLPKDELDRFLAAINRLTCEDIKIALAKIIIPEQMVIVTTGPQ